MGLHDVETTDYPTKEYTEGALLFAFDRDHTVDVNPPAGDRAAVPLAWIRHLAHETDHVVFATGNQTLKTEAEIPGTAEIVHEHPELTVEAANQRSGLFGGRLSRRERVTRLGELYPTAPERIVVDDVDLSRLEGWTHYFPWDFHDAVRRGDVLGDVLGNVPGGD